MLSMTDIDAPKFAFTTPEDVKEASAKAMSFWVGALSPMWVPFWAASSFGVGAWALSQSLSRNGLTPFDKDMSMATKWPGFASPFLTPWSRGYGVLAEEINETVEIVEEAISEPVMQAFVVEEKLETAIAEATQTVEAVTEPLIDPVTETPVVVAVAESTAEIAPAIVETVAKPVAQPVIRGKPSAPRKIKKT